MCLGGVSSRHVVSSAHVYLVSSREWLLGATGYLNTADATTRFVDGRTACRDLQTLVLRAGSLEPGRPERTYYCADCVRVRMRMRIRISLADELYFW